jgi:hypothetical protein
MLTVVWAYRRTGKFAFHVLTGALETDPRTAGVPIEFANGVDAVVAAITKALVAPDARVLVGWSFYSPDFVLMRDELQAVRARVADARVLHVVGGVHAAAEPEATLRAGWDLVAIGEGERLVRDLVLCLGDGGEPRSVPGIASLTGDGRCARTVAPSASCSTTSRRSGRPTTASGRSRSRAAASTRAASARRRTSPAPTSATAASPTCGSGRATWSAAASATSGS